MLGFRLIFANPCLKKNIISWTFYLILQIQSAPIFSIVCQLIHQYKAYSQYLTSLQNTHTLLCTLNTLTNRPYQDNEDFTKDK